MATSTKIVMVDESVNDEKGESWVLTELIRNMKNFINEFEMSQFYHDFRNEVQRKPISKHIRRVLGSNSKMQMVIYGIGSILNERSKYSKFQLSLAILMKKDFSWIGDVEVFDPILSTTEIQILKSFGFTVLSINEDGRRQALKPTIFFMPHCDLRLYNNLLEANWKPNLLSNVIIFGNSFISYINNFTILSRDFWSKDGKRKPDTWIMMGHILAAQTFTDELEIRRISYGLKIGLFTSLCEASFSGLTWHFFSCLSLSVKKMELMRKNTMKKYNAFPKKKENLAARHPSPKD